MTTPGQHCKLASIDINGSHIITQPRITWYWREHIYRKHFFVCAQPKCNISHWMAACTKRVSNLVQPLQNHAAWLILGDFDYVNFCGIELVKSLGLYTIQERRDYFLATLMCKSIHGIAPAYLCNQIVMNFDINGYDTRGTDSRNVLLTKIKERIVFFVSRRSRVELSSRCCKRFFKFRSI